MAALEFDKADAMTAAAIFLVVVAAARRYQIHWDTVLPWFLGAMVLGVRWYVRQQTAGGYYDRVLREYQIIQDELELQLPYLYREPDWISVVYTGLQTFPDHGVAYFRPCAQNLENIARILYYADNALGFDPIEWSVARQHATEALNHLLGLQYRTDAKTTPSRSMYAMVAYFRNSFAEKIPGFQPDAVAATVSRPEPHALREWYPPMG